MSALSDQALDQMRRRAITATRFLFVIASCGRRFFRHHESVDKLEVDDRGMVWFVQAYNGARIYTHRSGEWKQFSHGGTLKDLVEQLRDFIRTGERQRLNLGPWPKWICDRDLWGYGEDMDRVRAAARSMGIWLEKA